jgi:hypothetical protein
MRLATAAKAAPAATVAVAGLAAWLAAGVELGQIARYAGYELLYVVGPGLLLFRAISPETRGVLPLLAFGWPLGLVAEIGFYIATASLDVRDLFFAYPVLVGLPAALIWRRRARRGGSPPSSEANGGGPRFSSLQRWSVAGLCVTAVAYIGMTLFAYSPIPGSVPNVLYVEDLLFHITVATEAQQHWPVETPQVSGVVLHYHYFAHLHMAAIGDVTGIEMPIVVLRLWIVPLFCLLLLQLSLLGRAISGIAWAGPVTAGLFLLVWEIDLVTPQLAPFLSINQILAWGSPSYLLGLVFFVPLITLLAGLLRTEVRARLGPGISTRAGWVMVAILAAGAAGAKVVALPMLCAGLAACLGLAWLRRRSLQPTALRAVALLAGMFLVAVLALYGTSGGGMRLGAGGNFELMPALLQLRDSFGDGTVVEVLFWGVGSLLCAVLLLAAPLLGLVWYFRRGGGLGDVEAFLLGMTLAGFIAFVFIEHDVAASFYFTFYGVIAASPLAAAGLCRLAGPWLQGREGSRATGLAVAAVWGAGVCAVAYWSWQEAILGRTATAYAIAYAALLAGLIALAIWCVAAPQGRRGPRVALATLLIVATAAVDLAIDVGPESWRKLHEGETLYDRLSYGVKAETVEAAEWARDNLDTDAVLTISNQTSARSKPRSALATDFPAFAERRAFNEGWAFAIKSSTIDRDAVVAGEAHPYPERRELESRLFAEGDPQALETMMEEYGVTHLVVDREDGKVNPRAYELGRIVYSNGTIDIIELEPPAPVR